MSGKEVRKLNCYELIVASIHWCLDIDSVTVTDLRAFLEHLKCLASRVKNDDFREVSHVGYDTDVRKLAETEGFQAFDSKKKGISMFQYGTQNMKPKRPTVRKSTTFSNYGKVGCYRRNRESGCSRTDEQ